ncbi:MAG TPA: manganese transporter [Bacteroidetes bacterium]|nr:manganese transporter [Bacteroidota bacterium]HIL56910.1 manganese transporter [Rhodothermales bacterium]
MPDRRSFLTLALALLAALPVVSGCAEEAADDGRVVAVATTSIVADAVRQVGGEHVAVTSLMGPNVDPHLYRPSEGDVTRMATADVVFTNGLDLEGKMGEALEQLGSRGITVVAIAEAVPEADRRESVQFEGSYDPHVWMNPRLWALVAQHAADALAELDPEHAEVYRANAAAYTDSLAALDDELRQRLAALPDERRVLVTAHDAFEYFGRAYDFEVRGLQGLSTATEAGTADVQALARFVTEQEIPAMFVETSVSERTIRAVQEAVQARGGDVRLGEPLYSDALGAEGSGAETVAGMLRHNVAAIVEGLGDPNA